MRLLLVMMTLLVSAFSFAAQEDSDSWSIVSVTPLDALVRPGISTFITSYELSADQSMMAWIEWHDLCLYSLQSKTTRCYRIPYDAWRLSWSPDGSAIVLISGYNFYATLQLFDLTSGVFTLLEGNNRLSAAVFWGESGDTIYFLSAGSFAFAEDTPFLIAYSVQTRITTRTDLGGIFPPVQLMGDVQFAAVSPDGKRLMVSVPSRYGDDSMGLWLIDLETRWLKQIAPMHDLASAALEEARNPANIDILDVYWNEGRGALWVTIGEGLPSRAIGVLSIDLNTLEQMPLLPVRHQDSYPGGRITPDGALFIYLQGNPKTWYTTSMVAIPLDVPSGEPILLIDEVIPDCAPEYVLVTLTRGAQQRIYLADYSQICVG